MVTYLLLIDAAIYLSVCLFIHLSVLYPHAKTTVIISGLNVFSFKNLCP